MTNNKESEINNVAIFIGHNECYGVSAQQVERAIIDIINQGVTVFMSGGQGGFDRLCAGCVRRLKKQYPHIVNCLVIPYLTFNVFDKHFVKFTGLEYGHQSKQRR